MKHIELTQGFTATIDDSDMERVSAFKWRAIVDRRVDGSIYSVYAARNVRVGGVWTKQKLHRFLTDAPDGMHVDHIDCNGLNNSRSNLRICTRSENMRNRRPNVSGSSAFKGVSWNKQSAKWMARIFVEHKQVQLGFFADEESAARAYDAAAKNFFGSFARTNFKEADHG